MAERADQHRDRAVVMTAAPYLHNLRSLGERHTREDLGALEVLIWMEITWRERKVDSNE
jgi:hypothetical protein